MAKELNNISVASVELTSETSNNYEEDENSASTSTKGFYSLTLLCTCFWNYIAKKRWISLQG